MIEIVLLEAGPEAREALFPDGPRREVDGVELVDRTVGGHAMMDVADTLTILLSATAAAGVNIAAGIAAAMIYDALKGQGAARIGGRRVTIDEEVLRRAIADALAEAKRREGSGD